MKVNFFNQGEFMISYHKSRRIYDFLSWSKENLWFLTMNQENIYSFESRRNYNFLSRIKENLQFLTLNHRFWTKENHKLWFRTKENHRFWTKENHKFWTKENLWFLTMNRRESTIYWWFVCRFPIVCYPESKKIYDFLVYWFVWYHEKSIIFLVCLLP